MQTHIHIAQKHLLVYDSLVLLLVPELLRSYYPRLFFVCFCFYFGRDTVSQTCNEDGMEFTLRTPEGYYGRIYTYGFYDRWADDWFFSEFSVGISDKMRKTAFIFIGRCFFRGSGGTVNVLRISGTQGYPECGTQRVSIHRCVKIDTHSLAHARTDRAQHGSR